MMSFKELADRARQLYLSENPNSLWEYEDEIVRSYYMLKAQQDSAKP